MKDRTDPEGGIPGRYGVGDVAGGYDPRVKSRKRSKPERESDLNKKVIKALAGKDPCRIENSVGDGTPDIAYIGGWIEDKFVRTFPARLTSRIRVPKYKPEQRAWHVRHRMAGGVVYVVIQVADVFYAFDGRIAAEHLGFMTKQEMGNMCRWMCAPGWDAASFRRFIDNDKLLGIA